jgi:hypothetical protein
MIFQSLIGNCPVWETSGEIDAWPRLAALQFFNRSAHKPFCVHRFFPDRNSRNCHDPYCIERLFFHAALFSAVFIRLPAALLVAPRNFAPRIFVSLHCFLLRRPPARPAGLSAFRSDRFCSPGVRRREQSRSFKNETQKHEHDRKHQLNASTAEQRRQAA